MPATVNGIGTHYWGKKNLASRNGVCEFCRHQVALSSYDTRLWFVVLFLPFIPLGRKRIIDQCSRCSRHRVANADAYEKARAAQTAASLEQFHRDPSPKTALERTDCSSPSTTSTRRPNFGSPLWKRFPSDAMLRLVMAAQLQHASADDDTAVLYEEALCSSPSRPKHASASQG